MSEAKYSGTVLHLGDHALDFKSDGMVVLFGPRAGEALEPFCVIVDEPNCPVSFELGDKLSFGSVQYGITAVGSEASETFSLLGHCTLRFDGAKEAVLPGTVHLDGPFPEIVAGERIALT